MKRNLYQISDHNHPEDGPITVEVIGQSVRLFHKGHDQLYGRNFALKDIGDPVKWAKEKFKIAHPNRIYELAKLAAGRVSNNNNDDDDDVPIKRSKIEVAPATDIFDVTDVMGEISQYVSLKDFVQIFSDRRIFAANRKLALKLIAFDLEFFSEGKEKNVLFDVQPADVLNLRIKETDRDAVMNNDIRSIFYNAEVIYFESNDSDMLNHLFKNSRDIKTLVIGSGENTEALMSFSEPVFKPNPKKLVLYSELDLENSTTGLVLPNSIEHFVSHAGSVFMSVFYGTGGTIHTNLQAGIQKLELYNGTLEINPKYEFVETLRELTASGDLYWEMQQSYKDVLNLQKVTIMGPGFVEGVKLEELVVTSTPTSIVKSDIKHLFINLKDRDLKYGFVINESNFERITIRSEVFGKREADSLLKLLKTSGGPTTKHLELVGYTGGNDELFADRLFDALESPESVKINMDVYYRKK